MASRLERYADEYRCLVAELEGIGYISPGSLVVRETTCGKTNCRCSADPPQRHGPYYQWSRAVAGKTVSRRLDEQQADLYREWIANKRRLEGIISRMEEISRAAVEILLAQVNTSH